MSNKEDYFNAKGSLKGVFEGHIEEDRNQESGDFDALFKSTILPYLRHLHSTDRTRPERLEW